MFALADCNNFFVSCERVFRPELEGRPVIVLSSNDGCAIARSNEAKALGIKMGDPLFKIRKIVDRHDVTLFSSNMSLYADFSRRVRSVLRSHAPQVEVYSIDEAFLDLRGMECYDLDAYAKHLSRECRRLTGIPLSVGVAPTKTLAKIASKLCKHYPKLRGGCFMHRAEDIEKVLRRIAIEDVWGIGRRSAPRLKEMGIFTAYDFCSAPHEGIYRLMGITGLRTWRELHGIPSIEFEHLIQPKQSICNSRSFASEIYDRQELSEQIAKFATMTAEKLRDDKSLCGELCVFIATNRFRNDEPQQYGNTVIPFTTPTNSTIHIVRAARDAVNEIFSSGYGYKRAGVIATHITPISGTPTPMFDGDSYEQHRRLMLTVDNINRNMGHDTVVIASQGMGKIKSHSDYRSPRYTTAWDEIPTIRL